MATHLINCVEIDPGRDSILSLLSRLSVANHYFDIALLGRHAGLQRKGYSRRDNLRRLSAGQVDLALLAQLCDQPEATLQALTYPPISQTNLWRDHVYCGHVVPWTSLDPTRLRYCPICIESDKQYSRLWDLTWYMACHRHGVALIEKCETCGAAIDWDWAWTTTCTRCGRERMPVNDAAPIASVELADKIAWRAGKEGHRRPLGDLFRAIDALVVLAMPDSMLGRFDYSPHRWSISERERLIEFAWPMLQNKASSISSMARLIADSKCAHPALPDCAHTMRLHRAISSVRPSSAHRWLIGNARSANAALATVVNDNPAPPLTSAVTVGLACELIGTSTHNVMALVRAGLLAAQPARPGRKTPEWLLPLSSIDSLFSRIRKTVRPLTADTAGTDVNLNQFASMPRGAALGGIVGLVSAICEGRLLVQAEGDDVRFSALNVSTPSEGPGVPASAQPRKVTVKELASAWGMYPDVIYRLMKAGLLAFNLGDDGRRKHVDRRDAASFESRYIVVTQLARTLRVNPTNLSDRLIDAGLVPVSGPKVDKGLVYVFRRDDLSRLNLREVLSRPTYRSRAGRPRSGSSRRTPHDDVVDSTTAARMLDLSVQQLSRVVRGGYLPEHEDSRTKGNRRYLYRRDVENYRAAFISSSELQPLDDAAADLKCTRRQFFIRFVRSGRIAVEKAPHGETYVRRAQVEAVAARVAR